MDDALMRARFQKALDLGSNVYELEDIAAAVKSGAMQTFSNEDAFVVTQIGVFPRKKVLNILLLAGELDAVLALQPEIEAFGRQHGCELMTAMGRPGWQKILPKLGWRHTASLFTWDLGG